MFGVTAYPADNLSYNAWAQQARSGLWRFGILYTTTEHERLMFNSLFLLIGKLSPLLGVSPLLVLNVLGALSLPVFIFAFSSMCRGLGLGGAATFAATCLALGDVGWEKLRLGGHDPAGEAYADFQRALRDDPPRHPLGHHQQERGSNRARSHRPASRDGA